MTSVDSRLFTSSKTGRTYLFTRINGASETSSASLKSIEPDGSISEPLITKSVRKEGYIIREGDGFKSSVPKLPHHGFGDFYVKGDKINIAGCFKADGKINYLTHFELPKTSEGWIMFSDKSFKNMSPTAKRILNKIGEAFKQIKIK
ncbi:MAG TPA: hypothetical protein IAD11_09015 [Candidatus Stercorousia faecigallinarum]|nr:hypothetical protein [Candidatus Stercorousia faecigallinarum]